MSIKNCLLLGAVLCIGSALQAQSIGPSALVAAGNSATTGTLTHEFALGQLTPGNSYISSGLVVTPGVLQPAAATGIAPRTITEADLKVFPSQVESSLFLQPAFSGS